MIAFTEKVGPYTVTVYERAHAHGVDAVADVFLKGRALARECWLWSSPPGETPVRPGELTPSVVRRAAADMRRSVGIRWPQVC